MSSKYMMAVTTTAMNMKKKTNFVVGDTDIIIANSSRVGVLVVTRLLFTF